jgi:hypothetical protein
MTDSEILYRILTSLEKIERALVPVDPTALIKISERLTKLMERWDNHGIPPAKSNEEICRWYGDPFIGYVPAFVGEVNEHAIKKDSTANLCAFGDATRERIEAGDVDALVSGIAALAGLWFRSAGMDIQSIGLAANAYQDPQKQGVILAAIALRDVLLLSPQGRQAIANLGPKPVFQNSKSKGG